MPSLRKTDSFPDRDDTYLLGELGTLDELLFVTSHLMRRLRNRITCKKVVIVELLPFETKRIRS